VGRANVGIRKKRVDFKAQAFVNAAKDPNSSATARIWPGARPWPDCSIAASGLARCKLPALCNHASLFEMGIRNAGSARGAAYDSAGPNTPRSSHQRQSGHQIPDSFSLGPPRQEESPALPNCARHLRAVLSTSMIAQKDVSQKGHRLCVLVVCAASVVYFFLSHCCIGGPKCSTAEVT